MMASSTNFLFFLCSLFDILVLIYLTFSVKVSKTLLHRLLVPYILQSAALIQLMGAVRSTLMR